jgi:hypothetical protein
VTAIHSHIFMHFWANDDAIKLAKGLRAARDKTASMELTCALNWRGRRREVNGVRPLQRTDRPMTIRNRQTAQYEDPDPTFMGDKGPGPT